MDRIRTISKIVSVIFFLLFTYQGLFSQQYKFTHYSKERGLPGNQVWSIYQDSKGYMWFSTTAALVKYNGKEYQIYNQSKGLLGDFALNVREDSKGTIWIGCPGGVSKVQEGKITNYLLGKFDDFFNVFVDGYDRVWAYNFQFPNDLFVIEKDSVHNFSEIQRFKKQRVFHIEEDKNGAVYFLTQENKLYRFFLNVITEVMLHDEIKQIEARMFFFSSNGELVLCGNKGVASTRLHDRDTSAGLKWLLHAPSLFAIESKNKYYWIATRDNGLFRLASNQTIQDTLHITEKNGITTNHLFTLFEDREQNMWIGTNLKGICKLSSMRFITFGKSEGFNEEAILALMPYEGSAYCATENGVYRFSENSFSKLLLHAQNNRLFADRLFLCMTTSAVDNGLILGSAPGLYHLDNKGSLELVGLNNLVVQTLLQDSRGENWVGTNKGVFKLHNNKNFTTQEFKLENRYVNRLMEVNKKDLYVATDSGLFILEDAIISSAERATRILTTKDKLLSNVINDIVTSTEGEIVIGTSEGINVLTSGETYSITEGLHHRFINVLYIDSQERLWAGTDNGLHLLYKENGKFKVTNVFFHKDGIMSNEFTRSGTIYEDESGRIWFGTYGGLTVYNSKEEPLSTIKPSCFLSSLQVNDTVVVYKEKSDYEFNHTQNKLRFFFEGLSFFDEDAIQFEYFLEPLEQPWSNTTYSPSVSYGYLEPGNYRFHVRVKSPLGLSDENQVVMFNILSPFWKGSWFIGCSVIFLVLLGYLMNNLRLSRVRKRNLLLEQIVGEKTAELQNSKNKVEEQYHLLLDAQKELVGKAELEKAFAEIEKLKNRLATENIYLKEKQSMVQEVSSIVGRSEVVQQIRKKIVEVASTDSTVLVNGETGTGKNLVAEAIHTFSSRKERALITVNCAAIPEGLVESELFGHEKGAFTGANERRLGKFEIADGSTIFLDEIGDMNLAVQAKILNVLEERKLTRVGGSQSIAVDVRVIAATNHDLEELIQNRKFRNDLFYRLNVFRVDIPPLGERVEDIELLTKYFIDRFSKIMNKKIEAITSEALHILKGYSFPGNVRELENLIQRAVILCGGEVITDEHVTLHSLTKRNMSGKTFLSDHTTMTLEEMEKKYILSVLEKTNWKISGDQGAAEILGMHPNTLRSKMTKLSISFRRDIH
ncbi:MAG: sigma 54-interacting transcriptional regulator [Ignavibacteriae bacterium]|nr:sigma 54-interacting transcriptional regulator [Ignavibacteriota bacterium]